MQFVYTIYLQKVAQSFIICKAVFCAGNVLWGAADKAAFNLPSRSSMKKMKLRRGGTDQMGYPFAVSFFI